MKCPNCGLKQIRKNGHRRGTQNYQCKNCERQFIEAYTHRGYSDEVKQICLRMHQQGLGVRKIEKFTSIRYSTIYNWIRQAKLLHRSQSEN